jgi:predicted peroxiredoxin
MRCRVDWISVVVLVVVSFASKPSMGDEPVMTSVEKKTVFINLTSGKEDLHAVAMALHFAEHAIADGREAVVFFNVHSPPLANKDLDPSVRFKDSPPIREMIAGLLENGVKMVVCPFCAKLVGVTEDDLPPGIEMVKDRGQVFDHLHDKAVVFTY